MTEDQLKEIEARAKAATPGPWSVDPDNREGCEWNNHIVSPTGRVCFMSHSPDDNARLEAAAHHIADMDPATTLALTAALRQAWEENERLRKSVNELERPTMYWADGECPSQPPEDFLESEYQLRGEDEWEEEFGNEGVMKFMCAHSLPHVWVAYRRHPDGFVTSEHKTEEEARAALKEPTHD